jgi:hypothetical protein
VKEADWRAFFHLDDPIERRPVRVTSVGVGREEALRMHRLLEVPQGPMEVTVTSGTQYRDFLWAASIAPRSLVRERVIDLLVSEGLTGWATFPVVFRDEGGGLVDGYVGFHVVSQSEELAEEAERLERYVFDASAWDGSDFFVVSGQWVITPRAERALRAGNVRNVSIEPLADVERPSLEIPGL